MRQFPDPDPGQPDLRSPGSYLTRLAGANRVIVALGVVYSTVSVVANALIPAAIGRAVDDGLTERDQRALLLWGGAVLALGILQAVTGILHDRCALTASLGGSFRTLQFVTDHATRLGASLPRRVSAGEVMSVGVADVGQIGNALAFVSRAVGAVAAVVVVAAIMLVTSWQLGLVVLVGVPVMVVATTLTLRPLHRRQVGLRAVQSELTSSAVDIVGGLRVLRGIGGEQMFADGYRSESQRARRAAVRVARVEAVLDGAKVLLPGLLVTAVVWQGARYVLDGRLTPGQLVAFYGYATFLSIPLRRLTNAAGAVMKGVVAARRVTTLLSLQPHDTGGASPTGDSGAPPTAAGAGFHDPVSGLRIEPGRLTAVVCAFSDDAGPLADRIGRYADSDVTFGDVPLRQLDIDDVRRRILVVDNAAHLFSGSLRVELDPAGRAARVPDVVHRAVGTASAHDVLAGLPAGLDTVVADAGRELSGGQGQRLRLARALTVDPEVLVLVEPTSAVDAHTESRIAAGLAAARDRRTTVVFSTSPILLDCAEHVVFVEAGKAVAEGTHAELLADDRYRAVVAREEDPA
ncbi:ABC-type multidrug transport system fused ATPase/permease subunit [Haloactinopolyspora alba]|uniref:ABC-type multidrug transport system fused ATPase/permease subunit n=1 Tax=Haloactinopolyspora alba TaxID=648780 RepID=A0A2P8DX59_9ACTN|nr:ABC transporter ATP-binding protein [Haloactinopolyspora alba]PSL01811.1 ABC-type multidrug transport system fused ATPase/permease subunit [Haloactinopolyspora alba]